MGAPPWPKNIEKTFARFFATDGSVADPGFHPGQRVRLCGLVQRPEMNGVCGELVEYITTEGRWRVRSSRRRKRRRWRRRRRRRRQQHRAGRAGGSAVRVSGGDQRQVPESHVRAQCSHRGDRLRRRLRLHRAHRLRDGDLPGEAPDPIRGSLS